MNMPDANNVTRSAFVAAMILSDRADWKRWAVEMLDWHERAFDRALLNWAEQPSDDVYWWMVEAMEVGRELYRGIVVCIALSGGECEPPYFDRMELFNG